MDAGNLQSAQIGEGLSFDNINDTVSLGDDRSLVDGASAATFSAWVRRTSVADNDVILTASYWNAGNPTDTSRVALETFGDELRFIIRPGDDGVSTDVTTVGADMAVETLGYAVHRNLELCEVYFMTIVTAIRLIFVARQ